MKSKTLFLFTYSLLYFTNSFSQQSGTIGCPRGQGANLNLKYVTPIDGTVQISISATNIDTVYSHELYLRVYDRDMLHPFPSAEILFDHMAPGESATKTILLFCRASGDSLLSILSSNGSCFGFNVTYDVISNNPTKVIDVEPNGSNFSQANYMTSADLVKGTIGYGDYEWVDGIDNFKTLTPKDGTVRVIVQGTNTGSGGGSLVLNVFDKYYNSLRGYYTISVATGTTFADTSYFYCRAVDTMYFYIQSNASCFSYNLHYDVINNNPPNVIDVEPNQIFAEANPVSSTDLVKGTLGYGTADGTDYADYYKAFNPKDGTIRVIIKATNTGKSSGYSNLYAHDRNTYALTLSGLHYNTHILPGATFTDTGYLYCRTPDSIYFSIYQSSSSTCFSYELHYEVLSFPDTTLFIVCANDQVDLTTLYDTAGYTVQWNTTTPKSAGAGTYNIIFTRSNNCKDTSIVVVKQEVATWTGTINTNWHTSGNWTTSKVPDSKTHVIIPASKPDCVVNTDATAASVQSRTDAVLKISTGHSLIITSKCNPLPN